jgi:hypothetical protein
VRFDRTPALRNAQYFCFGGDEQSGHRSGVLGLVQLGSVVRSATDACTPSGSLPSARPCYCASLGQDVRRRCWMLEVRAAVGRRSFGLVLVGVAINALERVGGHFGRSFPHFGFWAVMVGPLIAG